MCKHYDVFPVVFVVVVGFPRYTAFEPVYLNSLSVIQFIVHSVRNTVHSTLCTTESVALTVLNICLELLKFKLKKKRCCDIQFGKNFII